MRTEHVDCILITTQDINLTAMYVAVGSHLREVETDARVRPPRCTFHVLWSGDYWSSIARLPDQVLPEVLAHLDDSSRVLDREGERHRASDINAIREALAAYRPQLSESATAFESLWKSGKLRVEPRLFDRSRKMVTDRMRDAQSQAMRSLRNG